MQQANWHSNRTGKPRVILLVEDHDIYREVVRAALGKYLPDFEMLGRRVWRRHFQSCNRNALM